MTQQNSQGIIEYDENVGRRTDYLYRVSLKCLIRNDRGEVLVVKENGRGWWDLPGGGMDHNEDIKSAIARELTEEVGLTSDFTHHVIDVENPRALQRNSTWQLRIIFHVKPEKMTFNPGADGDEVTFMAPDEFRDSGERMEQLIYKYSKLLKNV